MLRPQDVFLLFEQFEAWWVKVLNGSPSAAALEWQENTPCVPGSYGCTITLT